jgi:dual specificity MAP kinase phosphatase
VIHSSKKETNSFHFQHYLSMARQQPKLPIKSFEYSELIENFLYLGSSQTSKNLDGLHSLNITHIVNLAGKCHYPSEFTYGTFHIEDGLSKIKCEKNLPLILQFIDQARQEKSSNRVLIHCRGGISRTPFIAIAYLIHSMNMILIDAFNLVKNCRPQIHIHEEHCKILLDLDKSNSCTLEFLMNK